MFGGFRKLGESSTFACTLVIIGIWVALDTFGRTLSIGELLTLFSTVAAYSFKEGASKIGTGMAAKANLVHVGKLDASAKIVEAVAEDMKARTAANVDAGRI